MTNAPPPDTPRRRPAALRWFAAIAPGILVAATGVGAGDLITASLAGATIGLTLLWAALAGAVLKWTLNEGLARWQLATGTTLLEGWIERLGGWIQWVFIAYLLSWSVLVGGALVSACGAAGDGLLPLSNDYATSKIIWGVVHSAVGVALVLVGGYALFEKLMGLCIGMMFATVVATAVMLGPDWAAVGKGLIVPQLVGKDALTWTLALLGGVGGSLTLLSYGYWIREEHRAGREGLRACRLDLAIGYALTALFGIAMVVIGSRLPDVQADRKRLPVVLAGEFAAAVGPWGKWVFLAGFWGAVFSSLLGVWQSVPYLFADFVYLRRRKSGDALTASDLARTPAYRAYLFGIATVPLVLLWFPLEQVQKFYAVVGSLFMLLLAMTLLVMNNRTAWVGKSYRNSWVTNAVLVITMAFFVFAGVYETWSRLK